MSVQLDAIMLDFHPTDGEGSVMILRLWIVNCIWWSGSFVKLQIN